VEGHFSARHRGMADDRILANAAAVTFYTLLALFPAIAALVSVYALFADPHSITKLLDAVAGVYAANSTSSRRNHSARWGEFRRRSCRVTVECKWRDQSPF
jgi:hypothetical protein